MTGRYILDACALLALLRDETGADIVAGIINDSNIGTALVSIHKANLLEVYYDVYRTAGKAKADDVISKIKSQPIKIISEISDALFEEAGRLKALYKVSFADIFALAEASVSKAILLTADHHEMDKVEQNEPAIKFQWIR